jgi:hypothetical protein
MSSKSSLLAASTLAALALGCIASEGGAPEGPKKLALLVGIDQYETVSDLDGCVNDVENMKGLLRDKFGFAEEDIKVLANEQATRQAILDAFQQHLIARARQGDIVVFHYSGHGSQMKDAAGGDEPDQYDETIVPQDSRTADVYDIPDDSINALLKLLSEKTENVTFIFDSCHSGTVARATGKVRRVEKDERPPPPPDSFAVGVRGIEEGDEAFRPKDAKYVLLSGSASNQLSHEYFADGHANGAFTYFFAKEIRGATGKLTYRDVLDKAAPSVTALFNSQEPQIEGGGQHNFIFSDETSLAENHVLVDPAGQDRVQLHAGASQGLSAGSIYEVYAPGTKTFSPPATPVAKVEITRVDAYRSEGRILSGGALSRSSRAVEREHHYADRRLLVHYSGLDSSETLRKVKHELDSVSFITTVAEPRGYHLLLEEKDGHIATEGSDSVEISPRVPVADAGAVARVVGQIKGWASWYNVLSIDNQTGTLGVDVRVERVEDGGTRSPFDEVDDVVADFTVGEQFQLTVENKTDRQLYLSVLDLSTDGSIALVFPEAPGAREILEKRGTWKLKLVTTLPDGREEVRDIIKVFATSSPIDLSFLTQGGVRGDSDPLSQLLAQAYRGQSRGVARVGSDDWTTTEAVIRVRR